VLESWTGLSCLAQGVCTSISISCAFLWSRYRTNRFVRERRLWHRFGRGNFDRRSRLPRRNVRGTWECGITIKAVVGCCMPWGRVWCHCGSRRKTCDARQRIWTQRIGVISSIARERWIRLPSWILRVEICSWVLRTWMVSWIPAINISAYLIHSVSSKMILGHDQTCLAPLSKVAVEHFQRLAVNDREYHIRKSAQIR